MPNDYFAAIAPERLTAIRAEAIQALAQAVEAAFDRLPPPDQLQGGRSGYLDDLGAGNAYAVTADPPIPGYVKGQRFGVVTTRLNTGAATLDVNGLGPRPIRRSDGSTLTAGDLGLLFEVVFDGAAFLLTVPARNQAGLDPSRNLADLTSALAARGNLGLGTFAQLNSIALTDARVAGALPVAKGGTGSSNAADARAELGLGLLALLNALALTDNRVTGVLPVGKGGTGSGTGTTGLRNLGAGDLAFQNSVSLSGVQSSGTLPVSKGGTGGTTASAARDGLGLGSAARSHASDFVASGPVGGIDTAAFLRPVNLVSYAPGDEVSGSNLAFSDGNGNGNIGVSGRWRCHGRSTSGSGTLWVRVQ